MSSFTLGFSINVDLNQLINQVASATNRNTLNNYYFDGGKGRYISVQSGGKLISACYHTSKFHSATCEVHNGFTGMFGIPDHIVRKARSEAPPGKWAIACCDSGRLGGDKTFYNTF